MYRQATKGRSARSRAEPPRGDRLAEGCAIVVGAAAVYPASGGVAVEVEIWRGAPRDGD